MKYKEGDILKVKGELIEEIKKGGRIKYNDIVIYSGMANALLKNKDKIKITFVDRNEKDWISFEGGGYYEYRADFFESYNETISAEDF